MDAYDHSPDIAALEILRGLGQQRPYLRQFAVPVGQSGFQNIYDPVITNEKSPP